ncbi:MAG: ABC transporter permease subunit [Clostridia bacterium]|nr:ABC transporter permease subunit [Clostridia bacterium]
MLLVFVFNYLPMGGIIIAFKNYRYDKGIFGSEWVGFDNFKFFVESNEFFKLTRNTLMLNALFISVGIIAALAVAILLFCLKGRLNTKIYQTMMITPNFVSWVVASYMVYAFLSPQNGIINGLLIKLGMNKVDWYNTPAAWPAILTVAGVWKHVGMDCIIYYAALMGIDSTLFEAADVDGASSWVKIKCIIIPTLVPLLTILTILKIGGIFRSDFGMFYQLTRDVGALYDVTDVIDTYTYRVMRVIGNMGMGSAIGLLQSVVGVVLVLTTNYVSKKIDSELGLF